MTRVAIFGAAGYGGEELVRLLVSHPGVEITYLAGHSTVGQALSEMYPFLLGVCDQTIQPTELGPAAEVADVVFLALPHGTAQGMVPQALELGKKVIDFSADYRLKDVPTYESYYGKHPYPELPAEAVYGLPELHRAEIPGARLVAVPGCYPTSAILGLAPAAKAGLIDPATVIVDSKSGVSGAGRTKLTLDTHFAEINESVHAYNVGKHRHTPEIEQELSALGAPLRVTFSPHLIPMNRGILSTCYAQLTREVTAAQVLEIYHEMYDAEPFMRVLPEGQLPRTKHVTGSNRCHVGVVVDDRTGRLVVVSVIDNLTKGLAGAALQCMNLMEGYPETTALERPGIWP